MTTLAITTSQRNEALADLYRQNWPALREIMSRFQNLSLPYLIWVHPDYEKANIRLVVVGKETNGWEGQGERTNLDTSNQAVEKLMRLYREFKLGIKYIGKASYWTPVHDLYQRLNPKGPTLGFVALNASKMDQGSKTPNKEVRDAIIATGLLRDEIRILEPDVVVFHTGPYYESWLDGWFPDLKRTGDKLLCRLEAAGLPKHSFRSYHPQYLNRISKRKAVFDQIVAEVTNVA
ncbi:MAG: hypothetical protein NTY01_07420 [Verrucomicrobia bacterium]|nr:hypothetical protein [Verrucomicrobiota bacterium]